MGSGRSGQGLPVGGGGKEMQSAGLHFFAAVGKRQAAARRGRRREKGYRFCMDTVDKTIG